MTQPLKPVTYSIPPPKSEPARGPQGTDKNRFADLLRVVTPEESTALADTFGPSRPASSNSADPRGRHLDVKA